MYKRITLRHGDYNQTNMVLARLQLLQAKEEYYKTCFEPWGKFHPDCVSTPRDQRILKWLFPSKNFKEVCIVKWHSDEATTYFRNLLYVNQIHTPIWNSAIGGPDTYDFSKFNWHKGSMQVLDIVNNVRRMKKSARNG